MGKTTRTDKRVSLCNAAVPTECWERSGDAIVDVGNGRTASDFIIAVKTGAATAEETAKKEMEYFATLYHSSNVGDGAD